MIKLRKKYALDKKDEILIWMLTKDGRTADHLISEVLGISRPAVTIRRKALEEAGVIKGYSVIIDWDKVAEGEDIQKEIENEGGEGSVQHLQME